MGEWDDSCGLDHPPVLTCPYEKSTSKMMQKNRGQSWKVTKEKHEHPQLNL